MLPEAEPAQQPAPELEWRTVYYPVLDVREWAPALVEQYAAVVLPQGLADGALCEEQRTLAELCGVPGSVGFLPFYETLEALQQVHGLVPHIRTEVALPKKAVRP
jgi:hypothetical protein